MESIKHEKFCPMIFSKILLPTDFSEPAGKTISFMKEIKNIQLGSTTCAVVRRAKRPVFVVRAQQKHYFQRRKVPGQNESAL